MPKVKLAVSSLSSIVLGVAAGYLAVCFMGIDYSLPAKFIVLMLCFLLLNSGLIFEKIAVRYGAVNQSISS